MKGRVTLQDIAERLGVSKATVSLALRGQPMVAAATRRRVREEAARLGYRPDPALAVVAAHRWRSTRAQTGASLAWIHTQPPEQRSPYLARRLQGARERAASLGHHLESYELTRLGARRLNGMLLARGVRGVLVEQTRYTLEVPALDWERFAVVAVGFARSKTPFHLVRDDSFFSIRTAWREVAARGYARIGTVFLPADLSENELRLVSAHLGLEERLPRPSRVQRLHWTPGDLPALERWVRTERPDGVIGFDRRVGAALRTLGLLARAPAVPDAHGIGYASLDVGPDDRGTAGIDHLPERVGSVALEFLDLLLRRGEYGLPDERQALLVGTRWIDGDTLPVRNPTLPQHSSPT